MIAGVLLVVITVEKIPPPGLEPGRSGESRVS